MGARGEGVNGNSTKQLYQVNNGRVSIHTAVLIKCDSPSILSLNPENNHIGISETDM